MVKTVAEVRQEQLAAAYEILKRYSDEYELKKEENRIVIKGLASQALMRREDIVKGLIEKQFDLLSVKKITDTEIDISYRTMSAEMLTTPYSMWKYRTGELQMVSRKETPEETELLTGIETVEIEGEEESLSAYKVELTDAEFQKLQIGESIQKEIILDDDSTFLITISLKKKDYDEGWVEKDENQ